MPYELPTLKISDGDGGFMTINEADFDEKSQQPFEENSTRSLESKTKPELIELAKAMGIDTKGLTKADIIAALEDKEKT